MVRHTMICVSRPEERKREGERERIDRHRRQCYQYGEQKLHCLVKTKNSYDRNKNYKISMCLALRRNLKILRTGLSVISHTNAVLQLSFESLNRTVLVEISNRPSHR